jgi:crotonobetainyl-CoA:carnitine CoA-transferase CaiB-like acyl-CoA transferase
LLADRIQALSREELDGRLVAEDVPFSWVNRLADVPDDPQIAARGMFVDLEATSRRPARHVRQPLRFAGTAPGPRTDVPALGQHSREVLLEAGYDSDHIAELLASGVISVPSSD